MMQKTVTDERPGGDQLLQARARAAASGAFDPSLILDLSTEQGQQALGLLADECEEVAGKGGDEVQWILKPEARLRILQDMSTQEILRILDEGGSPSSDDFGSALQRILRDGADAVYRAGTDLDVLRSALQFAAPSLDSPNAREQARRTAAQVDLSLSRRDVDEAIQVLLPRQLIGRERELRKLTGWAKEKKSLDAEEILWLTGVGGTGKSALLAELARRLRGDSWRGATVLQVDFDRPALYRGTLNTLMVEISRQLGLHYPTLEPALSDFRELIRQGDSNARNKSFISFETQGYEEHRGLSAWTASMREHLPFNQRILLVLDTAEEVGQSSEFDLPGLRRWLMRLRTHEGFPNLRVIMSGRAFADSQLALVPKQRRLELGDLQEADAKAYLNILLQQRGIPDHVYHGELVRMLGGNPLSLKILATYLSEGGQNAAFELLNDQSGFDKKFAQAFLYKRVLNRLRTTDPDLVKIAHPGLVLRRVTPDLILRVLAEPCGLQNMSERRAKELFDQLTGQVWLVQRTANPNVVLHRRDLRRLMLQAMAGADSDRANAIHAAAAKYYAEEGDRLMTKEERDVESLYHGLFLAPGPLPNDLNKDSKGYLKLFARSLGEDLETIPVQARARLKVEIDRDLSLAEERSLPSSEVSRYYNFRDRKAIRFSGEDPPYDRELRNAAPVAFRGLGSVADADVDIDVQLEFERGRLRTISRSLKSQLSEFIKSQSLGISPLKGDEDLVQSALWRSALASMGRRDSIATLLESLRQFPEVLLNERFKRSSHSRITNADVYRMLFRLHGADAPLPTALRPRTSRLIEVQDLRYFLLLDDESTRPSQVPVNMLSDLSKEFEQFIDPDAVNQQIEVDRGARSDLWEIQKQRRSGRAVTLSDLAQMGRNDGALFIEAGTDLSTAQKQLLVGRLTEVYVLVRIAARACPSKIIVDFASAAAAEPLWPSELRPLKLSEALRDDRERWSATLISCTDRFGMLNTLMDWLEDRGRLKGNALLLLKTVRDYQLRLQQYV